MKPIENGKIVIVLEGNIGGVTEVEDMEICEDDSGEFDMDQAANGPQLEWRLSKIEPPPKSPPKPLNTAMLNSVNNFTRLPHGRYSFYETNLDHNKLHAERQKSVYFNELFKSHMKKVKEEAQRRQELAIKVDQECSFPLMKRDSAN